jgi:hypothetical protein
MSKKSVTQTKKRRKRLSVFFNEHEYAAVVRLSEQIHIRPSELVRGKLLTGVVPIQVPQINLEAWQKLARVAANLNQIARFLNEGMRLDVRELSSILSEFRLSLVSASSKR